MRCLDGPDRCNATMGLTASSFTPFEKNSKSIESMLWGSCPFQKRIDNVEAPHLGCAMGSCPFHQKFDHFNGNHDAKSSNAETQVPHVQTLSSVHA